jgi:hypothetical protein
MIVILACSIALSACTTFSSGFTYFSHRSPDSTLLGFKAPTKWKSFDTQQVLEALNGPLTSAEAKNIANGEWMEYFSPTKKPIKLITALEDDSKIPIINVEARPLSVSERDSFSLASLRSEILGSDPFAAASPSPFDVTSYNEFANTSDGIRGSTLTTNITLASGATVTLSQIVEVDADTNWVFAIAAGCSAGCWGPNSGLIKQVLNSWAVKETKS